MLLLKVEASTKADLNDRRHFHPHRVSSLPDAHISFVRGKELLCPKKSRVFSKMRQA